MDETLKRDTEFRNEKVADTVVPAAFFLTPFHNYHFHHHHFHHPHLGR